MTKPLVHWLSVGDVAEQYHIDKHSVQEAIRKHRLKHDQDCVMKGGIWLIFDAAAERLWSYRRYEAPPGQRVCKKCLLPYPATAAYFKPYTVKGVAGLSHSCKGCLKLQDAAYYQRRKVQLRPAKRLQMRVYRSQHPEREARAQKKYRLKRSLKRIEQLAIRQEATP